MENEFINVSENNKLYKNGKRIKTSNFKLSQIAEWHDINPIRCFFCTRTFDQLGKEETLEIEHIIQLCDGGQDKLENLQILCTACHELKNWTIKHIKKDLLEYIALKNKTTINLHDFWTEPTKPGEL